MKFGVLQFFSWPGRRVPLQTVYARAFERMKIMDESGYDAVWLAEHHFSTYSVCPSVHIMGTHIAAHTTRLRIGTAVSLAGFYHPLRLAEEVALLDVISGGRVNWGAGRGFDPTEHKAFGVEPTDSYAKFRESVDIVLKAWNNEKVTHDGKFWQFDGIEVLPKPHQDPMPVWIAASSQEAMSWAAKQGHSIMMSPHSTHPEIRENRAHYQSELEAAGFSIAGRDIPMARTVALAETQQEAEEIGRRGAEFMFGSYLRKKQNVSGARAGMEKTQPIDAITAAVKSGEDPVARYVNQVAICGTPEKVIDDIQRLRETNSMEYLMIAPLSHSSFMMFTEKVVPAFL
ncbi:MAG: LLM class flavin-dependent oxidoreductase [Rhodospirillaceae bacterium]|nr:LLM class flavin-dependent oxidoreductase [Rhodospirillaceae bacterium]MBT5808755.1 LLM class flavin-dependent oxidoreductase [Rhodospirillaceae bacterium]